MSATPRLDVDFLKRCEGLFLAVAPHMSSRFLGRRVRRTLAGGTEVTDYSDYTSGDDYRYVDWGRAARLDELVSKQFHGGEDRELLFLLDAGGSMQTGAESGAESGPTKFELARTVTAALGYLALRHQERVCLYSFASQFAQAGPPLRGRQQADPWLKQLEGVEAAPSASDLSAACESFLSAAHPPGLVVILSDLLDPAGFVQPLDSLRRYGHQLHVVQLYAPADAYAGVSGLVTFHSAVGGEPKRSWIDRHDLENYREVFDEFCASIQTYCRRYQVMLTQISTDMAWESIVGRMVRGGSATMAAG
jgi:uncharacterized protein (DUF58 family)